MPEAEKELLLRVSGGLDSDASGIDPESEICWTPTISLTVAEMRTISRVLREAAEGPKVVLLSWAREPDNLGLLVARPGVGRIYSVVPLDGGFIVGGRPTPIYPTESAAQDAAQAIHDTHIRSALRPLPAPPSDTGNG